MKYTKASKVRRNGATIFQRLGECVLLLYGEVRWVERKGGGWQNIEKTLSYGFLREMTSRKLLLNRQGRRAMEKNRLEVAYLPRP